MTDVAKKLSLYSLNSRLSAIFCWSTDSNLRKDCERQGPLSVSLQLRPEGSLAQFASSRLDKTLRQSKKRRGRHQKPQVVRHHRLDIHLWEESRGAVHTQVQGGRCQQFRRIRRRAAQDIANVQVRKRIRRVLKRERDNYIYKKGGSGSRRRRRRERWGFSTFLLYSVDV